MILLLIVILLVLIGVLSVFKIGDAFSPWMITLGVWLGIFLMFSLFGDNLYPLKDRLYTCVMIWVPVFSLLSIAVYYALPTAKEKNTSLELSKKFYMFFLLIAVVCSPLYLYQIVKVAMMFDLNNMVNNIRIFSSYGEKDTLTIFLKYVCPINQALFIVEMWRYPN